MDASFKSQSHKMVKHTQTIRRQKPTNCLSVFDHFVGLALKGLRYVDKGKQISRCWQVNDLRNQVSKWLTYIWIWNWFLNIFQVHKKVVDSFNAVSIYLFRVNYGNNRTMREICSKLAIKTTERLPGRCPGLFI